MVWVLGIRTSHGKFLTVETFGDQLNASGPAMRNKQLWTLEVNDTKYALKGPNGKYLSSDHKGDINAKATAVAANEVFEVIFNLGRVTIKNSSGKFLSADAAGKVSVAATAGASEQFSFHLNIHPQVCFTTGKQFLAVEKDEVASNKPSQFGVTSVFTIEETANPGQFAIEAANGKYVAVDNGKVVANKTSKDDTTTFAFEWSGDNLGIKSVSANAFLSVVGSGLKAAKPTIGQKEIFSIIKSDPLISLKAHNNKFVSFQGSNLICNRDSITDSNEEIFLLEFDAKENKYAVKTFNELYWSAKDDGSVIVDAKARTAKELFTLEYAKDGSGKVALKTATGKYMKAAPLGGVDGKSTEVTAKELFQLQLLNRPQIVLQSNQQSFVGSQDDKVKTKSNPETLHVEYKDGKYTIKNGTSKYFGEGSDAKLGLSSTPSLFAFELMSGKVALKTEKGKYVKADTQGWLFANADAVGATELYDF